LSDIKGSFLGNEVRRTEDPKLLLGEAQFMDDLDLPGMVQAAFVRSMIPHAKILGVDTTDAKAMPGVVDVFTAADLELPDTGPPMAMIPAHFSRPMLARDVVRFIGEQIAVVVAETRAQAVDAAEAVVVDYEPLTVLPDVKAATADGAPVLFEQHGSNVTVDMPMAVAPDALDGADVVARGEFLNQRLAPCPMEVDGTVAAPDPETGGLKVWVSCQGVFGVRDHLCKSLDMPEDKMRVMCPAVGGGFGAKGGVYPEQAVIAALARRLERPVQYVQTRSENMLAMVHGRGQLQEIEIGATRDGKITGLRGRVTADAGAYPNMGAILGFATGMMSSGVYAIPKIDYTFRAVVTNTTPIGAYRGAGRPEAAAMIERCMDVLARELGMDPVELRRRNYIQPDAFPYTTPANTEYDSGNYEGTLDEALRISDYESLRTEQAARRERGDTKQLGIGLASYVEVTAFGGGQEFASVDVHPDGTVTVRTGTSPHGQGHETAFAQIAAGVLDVPIECITVVHSDTFLLPSGGGTGGSRSLQVGGSAVLRTAEAVLAKAKEAAANALEASVDDIVAMGDGKLGVTGSPASAISIFDLAAQSEGGLSIEMDVPATGQSFPFGTHVAVVEVDTDTGDARLIRHVAVDDCGNIVNPMLVRGQQHGGIGQGAAQALYEHFQYDDDGNPLTASYLDYMFPSAADLPSFETANTQTPSPHNALGAKGIGESATIGSTPSIQNAVVDALSHLGVKHIDMPLSPERVWRALQSVASSS
jgi:carbon-monoxide dehydrogenase large subunit